MDQRQKVTSTSQVTTFVSDTPGDQMSAVKLGTCKHVTTDDRRIMNKLRRLKHGELFCDPDFPADDSTLRYSNRKEGQHITWLRPKDLVKKPVLLLDGTSRHDIVQGHLQDCTFLSACAAVAMKSDIVQRVIPLKQKLHGPKYKGLVQFRFWQFGKWVKVHVDDRLPVDEDKNLIFSRCSDPREFWVALLEKAYAKLSGSYEYIEFRHETEPLADLTGGLANSYDLGDIEEEAKIFDLLLNAFQSSAFVTCAMKRDDCTSSSRDNKNGLVSNHAYTISAATQVHLKSNVVENLVRIRNPWGNNVEWTGKWSDRSKVWKTLDKETKKELNYVKDVDGEFWMCYKDFTSEFETIFICTLGPDFDEDGIADKFSQMKAIHGCWQLGTSCGGCRNDLAKFATNPQYLLVIHSPEDPEDDMTLDAADEDDDDKSDYTNRDLDNHDSKSSSNALDLSLPSTGQKYSVTIALMQECRRRADLLQIGYILYNAEDPSRRLTLEHFANTSEVRCSNNEVYTYDREVFESFELEAGNYVIVPSTFVPDCPANFMIRVYCVNNIELRELPS